MSNRTVEAQKSILISLLSSKLGFNELQKQTSSDKKFFEETLKSMRRGNLVEQTKDIRHKQKRIHDLTLLGREFAELVSIVNDYKELSKRLGDKIESFPKLSLKDPKKNPRMLLSKGWKQNDIDDYINHYIPYLVNSNRLRYYLERSVNELFIYRYVRIKKKYQLNRTGDNIVDDIMSTVLYEYVQTIINYFKGMKTELLPFYNLSAEISEKINRYNNKFIESEIKEISQLMKGLLIPIDVEDKSSIFLSSVGNFLPHANIDMAAMSILNWIVKEYGPKVDDITEKISKELKIDKSKVFELLTDMKAERTDPALAALVKASFVRLL